MHTHSIARTKRFGRRRTVDGETPWGQNYAVAAIKENITVNGAQKEVARAVVYETGASLLSRLKRAGYEDTAEAKLGLKRMVAMKAVSTQKLLAGFVPAGSFTSTGSMSSFTKDLTAWLVTAPTEAIAVVLIGFPDLEPDGDGGAGGPMAGVNTCVVEAAKCYISSNPNSGSQELCSGSYMTPQNGHCGSGYHEVKLIQHCLAQGTVASIPEIGGSVSAGREVIIEPEPYTLVHESYCKANCGSNATCWGLCESERPTANARDDALSYYGKVSLNNTPMATYLCRQETGNYGGPPSTFGAYNLIPRSGPNASYDVVCCN